MTDARIGIVGLGLVGGSLAIDLLDRGVTVVGTDLDAGERGLAGAAGVRVVDDVTAVATSVDVVVVAVPPAAVAAVVAEVAAQAPEVVVTDVASVKALGPLGMGEPPRRWIGGHPMAGTERSGFSAARPGMLAGATWVLTPTDEADPAALVAVLDLVLQVGAVPVVLDADAHDRLVAAVSHVTHLLSYALHGVAGGLGRELVDLVAGPSFRDATRVAASDPAVWADVTHRNRTAVRDVLGEVQEWLTAASEEDAASLTERLAAARRRPATPVASDEVAVDLDDVPSSLARLRALGLQGHAITGIHRGPEGVRVLVGRR